MTVYVPTLDAANAIRLPRARLLRGMSALPRLESRERAAELIENPPPELYSMRIDAFLLRVRGIAKGRRSPGPGRAALMLTALDIRPGRTLRDLRVRERIALAEALRPGRRL